MSPAVTSSAHHRFSVVFLAALLVLLPVVGSAQTVGVGAGQTIYLPVIVAPSPSLPAYAWHSFFGSPSFDVATEVKMDSAGNIFIGGYSYSAWLGPKGELPVEPYLIDRSATLIALDAQGNYRWHTFVGEGSGKFALAPDGAIYLAGWTEAWLGPQGQLPRHPASSGYDFSITALDAAGHYRWHTFYGGSAHDYLRDITVDRAGNLVITGSSRAAWKGPNNEAPLHPYTSSWTASENGDVTVLKLDAQGNYLWHTFYGGESADSGSALAVASDNAIYVSGCGRLNFPGDGGAAPLNAGWTGSPSIAPCDVLALKLDPSGRYMWHTFWGKPAHVYPMDMAMDAAENVYISTYSHGDWPGAGERPALHPYSGNTEAGVLKLSRDGQYVWHTFYGTPQYDDQPRLSVSPQGAVYLTWGCRASWSGPGGIAPLHPFAGGVYDIAVVGLLPSGSYHWHTFYGGQDSEFGYAAAVTGHTLLIAGRSDDYWTGDGGQTPKRAFSGTSDMTVLAFQLSR